MVLARQVGLVPGQFRAVVSDWRMGKLFAAQSRHQQEAGRPMEVN